MAQVAAAPVANASTDSMQFGDMMLDREHRQLFDAAGEEVHLTNSEYRLLEYFLVHPNEIIPGRVCWRRLAVISPIMWIAPSM